MAVAKSRTPLQQKGLSENWHCISGASEPQALWIGGTGAGALCDSAGLVNPCRVLSF
jgi:hypothetical protein